MKIDSIKTRLLLVVAICLLGMVILVSNQIYNTDRFINLNHQSKQLLHLSNDLLQLRRHEKDFLLRLDMNYVSQFDQQAQNLQDNISALAPFLARLNKDLGLIEQLQDYLAHYREGFDKLVRLRSAIGLDENSGYHGAFRRATHQLESQLQSLGQTELQLLLLQLRRHEKDFLQRKRMEYVEREQALFTQLSTAISNSNLADKTRYLAMLDTYQQEFMQLVMAYQQIGLDYNQGLLGEFRQQAHQLENQLIEVDRDFSLMLSHTEQQIETYSLFIMSATALSLIVLLIKSYLTFQRAFLNFVMFFYRCKREYQHMDGKKLGFSEFKYLASIANEMVDARRETERQLHLAQQHIAELKKATEQA